MDNKYKIIVHNTQPQYMQGCPVILKATAITKDQESGRVFAQCKFENLGDKKVEAIYISLECKGIDGQSLESVEYKYMDLNADKNCEFGSKNPIYLPHSETRKITIVLEKIIFSDETIWNNESRSYFTDFNEQIPITSLAPLDIQYAKEVRKLTKMQKGHKYLPMYLDGFVQCGCGKILIESCEQCPDCGADFEKLINLQNEEHLAELVKKEELDKDEREAKKKEKIGKWLRIIVPVFLVAVIIAGIVFLNSDFFVKNINEDAVIVTKEGETIKCNGFEYKEYYNEHVNDEVNPYEGAKVSAVSKIASAERYANKTKLTLKSGWIIYAAGGSGLTKGDKVEFTGVVARQSEEEKYTELTDVHYSVPT